MAETVKSCSVEGCNRAAVKRGWCEMHYARVLRNGATDLVRARNLCAIDGCADYARGGGLCSRHYQRQRRHGIATAGRTDEGAPLAWLEAALAAEGDDCMIWPFAASGNGYGVVRYDGRSQTVSRLICERTHGPAPSPDFDAAHSCNRRLCGNKQHISWKTRQGNMADAIAAGTWTHGDMASTTKLTEADVLSIRALRGIEHRGVLASRYGVTAGYINALHRRARWAWLG